VKILLDENVPRPLRRHLSGHTVMTVQEMGWAGVENGDLLDLAQAQGFEVLLTMDQAVQFEQNLSGRQIAIVILIAANNRVATLVPLIPKIEPLLPTVQPGNFYQVN
jgi:hypothetical protein